MTGGIMPKLSAMRWPIGIVAALLLIAGVSLSWDGSHASRLSSPLSAIAAFFGGDEYGGERRELELLQAALQRIEADLHQQANGRALASLRTEQEAVLYRVHEVARRVPADRIPPDIRRLIEPKSVLAIAPGTAPGIAAGIAPGSAARPIEEAAPSRPAGELRVGLRAPSAAVDFSGLALDQRPPWPLFTGRKPAAHASPAPVAPSAAAVPADRAETRQSSR
jgi:hypothetical protein